MSTGEGATQGDAQAQGATEGTTDTTDAAAQGGTAAPQQQPFDQERAMATIKAQRESERTLKAQLAEVQGKLKEHEDAKLSESERAAQKHSELEAENAQLKLQIQEARVKGSAVEAAVAAGARYPEDVWRLIDLAEVEYDADGKPKNMAKLVDGIRKDRPDYFRRNPNGSADGGARPDAGSAPDMNDLIRRKAGVRN